MKKLVFTGIATLAVALGAYAQGLINLNNATTSFGVTTGGNNFYSGAFGMEVWELTPIPTGASLTTALGNINSAANATAAYTALGAEGFKNEGEFNGTMSVGSFTGNPSFQLSDPAIAAGSSVVLGLAVWNSSATSWAAAAATAGTLGGAIAFVNPTVAPSTPPPIGADINAGWTTAGQNLAMTAITSVPEPGTLALAGLGVAAMLIFRRRK